MASNDLAHKKFDRKFDFVGLHEKSEVKPRSSCSVAEAERGNQRNEQWSNFWHLSGGPADRS